MRDFNLPQLCERAASGDRAAADRFWQDVAPLVAAVVRRALRSPEQAAPQIMRFVKAAWQDLGPLDAGQPDSLERMAAAISRRIGGEMLRSPAAGRERWLRETLAPRPETILAAGV